MKHTLFLLSLLLCLSCQAQNKEVNMEDLIQKKLALTENYEHRPLFSAQLNKTACKMIIEIEDSRDYRLTENIGESMMLPLNIMMLKKGKQRLKIKIYPRDGEEFLTKYATASVTLYRAPDKKSSMKEYEKLGEFELPIDIEQRKLPYYETMLEFEADVPYDYQIELDKAKDLTKISDIEKRVVKKYNQLREMAIDFDENGYLKERLHSSGIFYNTLYANTYEEIKKGHNNKMAIVDSNPAVSDRAFLPIENYTMQFYGNGKIVALWQKNHNPMLYIKAIIKKGTPDEREFEGGDPIFLYMPEGSNELKIW